MSPPQKPQNRHLRGVQCHFGDSLARRNQPRGRGDARRGWKGLNALAGAIFPCSHHPAGPGNPLDAGIPSGLGWRSWGSTRGCCCGGAAEGTRM